MPKFILDKSKLGKPILAKPDKSKLGNSGNFISDSKLLKSFLQLIGPISELTSLSVSNQSLNSAGSIFSNGLPIALSATTLDVSVIG